MIFKFKKAGTWTTVSTYKRRVGGVWQNVVLGKYKSGATWPIYWDLNAIKIQAPPLGTYASAAGQVVYPSTAGANAYLVKAAPTSTGVVSTTFGPWKKPSVTFIGGDTVQIYVEKVSGDMEAGTSSAINTWLPLYPGSTTYKWYAENSASVRWALFKIQLKDQNNNIVVWWAHCTNNGSTVITYSEPVDGGGGGGGGGGGTDPGLPPEEPTEPF